MVGTWNTIKVEERDINSDAIQNTYNIPAGAAYLTFESNGNFSGIFPETISGTYQIGSFNGKDLIIFMNSGDSDHDTVEVIRFTGTELDFSTKIDDLTETNEDTYGIFYLTKQQ